jgi:type I restriction enzyme S subunit
MIRRLHPDNLHNGIGFGSTEFIVLRPKEDVDLAFLYYHTVSDRFRKAGAASMVGSAGQKRLQPSFVRTYSFDLPPLREQRNISQALDLWDTANRRLSDQIVAKLRFKQGLLQQVLAGTLRFKGFHDEWRTVHLKDVAEECEERNRGRLGTECVMAVTKAEGIIPMRERTIAADIDRYSVVKKDYFAYNPMRLNIGSIARWNGEHDVLVSPDYVVFHCKPPTDNSPAIDVDFLDQYRRSGLWERYVTSSGNGSVRVRIYFSDLRRMKLRLPSLAEQRKIADVLIAADKEIDLLKTQLDALKTQKKGLMQKLLTGQMRVKT